MTRSTQILGLALVAAAALVAVWFTRAERRAAGDTAVAAEVGPAATRASELTAPAPIAADEAELADDDPLSARREARRDERPRIAGRVLVAGGLPREEIRVVGELYVGEINRRGDRHEASVSVAADGSFTLLVPEDTRFALLDVEAASLALEEAVRAEPGASDVVLRPELLGRLTVAVVLPPGVVASAANRAAIRVSVKAPGRARSAATQGFFEAAPDAVARGELDAEGRYEAPRVPLGVALEVEVEHPFGPTWTGAVEPLARGEQREVVAELETGAAISGRVVDEKGAPVEGVRPFAELVGGRKDSSLRYSPDPNRATDATGAFRIEGLEHRTWRLGVFGEFANNGDATVDARAGDVSGVELRVERGEAIDGTIAWPDGRPANCRVTAEGAHWKTVGAADGAFSIRGLPPGPYDIEALAGTEGGVRVEGVQTGGAPLHLVLEPRETRALGGTVTDERGQPVEWFRATWVASTGETGIARHRPHSHTEFSMSGVPVAELTVRVTADGYLEAAQVVPAGPSPDDALRFVLQPAGVVRGRVVDSSGEPVRGASISLVAPDAADEKRTAMSQGDGAFELQLSVEVGTLHAVKEGYADSEPVSVDARPGATVEVVLRLRDSCRVIGRVLDARGRAMAGVLVSAWRARDEDELGSAETDVDGAFVFDGLPPGATTISSGHDREYAVARVELVPRQPLQVELRFDAPDPVHLIGRLVRAGQPVHEVLFVVLHTQGRWLEVEADSTGRFDVVLPNSGPWVGAVSDGDAFDPEREDVRSFSFDVPHGEKHELELDLETLHRARTLEELGY